VNPEAKQKIGEIVKVARGSMSQRGFAKILGVSYTALGSWEKGEYVPDIETLAQIAERAGYTMEELLNYLGLKSQTETSDFNQIIKQIRVMPLSQVALIVQAGANRLASAMESAEEQIKAS
jgi:transcriptional regulator with XRE-family HTH domain